MIEYFDIDNFGSFKNFLWNTVRDTPGNNVIKLKQFNILYGRNYSGKTTLSRIARSLETGSLPANYDAVAFQAHISGKVVSHDQIPAQDSDIRVYNRDFVDDNLSFLRDNDGGQIKPFALLGQENKSLAEEIAKLEELLGSDDATGTLRHDLKLAMDSHAQAAREESDARRDLKNKLTNKATSSPAGIKHNPKLGDVNYNTPKIEADISTIRDKGLNPLTVSEKDAYEMLIDEKTLEPVKALETFCGNGTTLSETVNELLTRKIRPTVALQDLLADAALQTWVETGMDLHRDSRGTCGFCMQPLPLDLWTRLDAHFSQESKLLSKQIDACAEQVTSEIEAVEKLSFPAKSRLYATFADAYDELDKRFHRAAEKYTNQLNVLSKALSKRKSEIFSIVDPAPIANLSKDISQAQDEMNALMRKSNEKTSSLAADQRAARVALRLGEVSQFMLDIDLDGAEARIEKLHEITKQKNAAKETLQKQVIEKEYRVASLKTQMRDERRGAEKVNEYLCKHFGHDGLSLVAVEIEGEVAFKFRIMRGDEPAYNLSEGECSLVAFCYFMAKLQDAESDGKDLIVWIDDPISSLDSNHIFFVFSLIEAVLAAPNIDQAGGKTFKYKQLIIATHNLEFLKYLRRLSSPGKQHKANFIVSRKKDCSGVDVMPSHLQAYVTEFNYLFAEICVCADPDNIRTAYQSFYGFANNLRKFLEAYLFFKYPSTSKSPENDHKERLKKFFPAEDVGSVPWINRLTNEYSHLFGIFDRSAEPIDKDEISRMAKYMLTRIKASDSDQYDALVQSTGNPDPLVELAPS